VTCDLACAALRLDNRHADVARLKAEHPDIYPPAPDQAARLAAIESGDGVGSHLWRLLASLGIKHTATCSCLGLAEEMNALGPAGCRRERARLAQQMRANAKAYGWGTVATAAARALASGLAWRLDLADVYGSLLDEAIRLAEADFVARPTVLAVPEARTTSTAGTANKVGRATESTANTVGRATHTANTVGRATPTAKRLILRTNLCPGDLLTLTAAIESLHQTYPGEYVTDVRTRHPAIWAHNPRITPLKESAGDCRTIDCHYPSIQRCNQESIPFLAGYTEHLAGELGRPLRLRVNRPQLYLSAEEAARPLCALWPGAPDLEAIARGKPIWLIDAGVKRDYPVKGWPVEYFQEVVDRTADRICWVQIGLRHKDLHPELRNVTSLLETGPPMRETILLASRASGGLGPVTFFQHLLAAWQRPYICLVGGREPATWVQYPLQHTLHTIGSLSCCRDRSCWKARVVPAGDGSDKDKSLCQQPVTEGLERPAARCMVAIEPIEVLAILERCLP
jgi:hypothetical protein